MTEAVIGALEIGTQIYGLAQQLPRDISTWKLNRSLIHRNLSSLQAKIGIVSQQLDLFSSAISSAGAEVVTANQVQYSQVSTNIQHCRHDVQKMSETITDLNRRMPKYRVTVLPLRQIADALHEVEEDVKRLLESIHNLAELLEIISNNSVKTPVWAPHVPGNYYIDLKSENPVKKVLDNILRSDPLPIGAILIGSGGMGKTTAICQIARNIRIRARFHDGVLFTALGDEATKPDVIKSIAYLVKLVGRKDLEKEIKQLDTIEEAVTEAATVFQEKQCMIIFDDVWRTFKYPDIISALSRLSTNERSKIVFTTRDSIYLHQQSTFDVAVSLNKRSVEESERILLKSAGVEKPVSESDLKCYDRILREADGLPLALDIAGSALKQLSISTERQTEQSIWSRYSNNNNIISGSLQDTLWRSIKFLELQTENSKYREYFRALSVVQKAERMPCRVLGRAFGESQSSAIEILESFEKYGLISIEPDAQNETNRSVVIRNFVLDFARELADEEGESSRLMMRWLSSFRIQDRNDENIQSSNAGGSFKEWWPVVEDDADNYIYKNVVRILERADMFDEVLWLINEPWWIQKQLKVNGVHHVRSDLGMSLKCVCAWDGLQSREKEVMRKWLKLLHAAITASYDAVTKSNWEGMVYTQLYGRLQPYRQSLRVAGEFLKKINHCAPRPFLLPKAGSFPAVSSSLREKIMYDGTLLVTRQINDCVHTVSFVSLDDAEDDLKNSLMLQVNDMSHSSVIREGILKTKSTVNSGTMNQDGGKIVLGTGDGCVILLKKGNGETSNSHEESGIETNSKWMSTVMRGHSGSVMSVALSGDGRRIASGSWDNTVRIWDLDNGEWNSTVLQHERLVRSVAISGDGMRIISGSDDKTIREWSISDKEWKSTELRGHESLVTSVAISNDGKRIVSGSDDKTVRLWDNDNGEWTSAELRGHERLVRSVAVDGNGMRIVSGSDDKVVRVWDMNNGIWNSTVWNSGTSSVLCVTVSGDGRYITSGSDDFTVHAWDMDEDESKFSNSDGDTARELDEENGEWKSTVMQDHDRWVRSVAASDDGRCIVCGTWGSTVVRVCHMENGNWKSTVLRGHNGWVRSVAVSGDGLRIVSGSDDETVRVWDMTDGKWNDEIVLHDHEHYVMSVAISGSGTRFVSGSFDNTVRVWNMDNDEWKSTVLRDQEGSVLSVAISNDGRHVVSGSDDKAVRVWDLGNGESNAAVLRGHEHYVMSVAVSDDGMRIVSGSKDGAVRLWGIGDDGTWNSIVLHDHGCLVMSVALSGNGRRIVSGSDDRTMREWNMVHGEWRSNILCSHESQVTSMAVIGDGMRLVSASDDGTVRLWNKGNGEWNSTTIRGHEHYVMSVAVSGDGRSIVSGSFDKTVRLWDIVNGEWKQSAIFRLNEMVTSVNILGSRDIIKAAKFGYDTQWWRLSSRSWEECSEPEGVVFEGGGSFSQAGSDLHAQLSPTHKEAMRVIQEDLNMNQMACTADGFVIWGKRAPFIGFVEIVAT